MKGDDILLLVGLAAIASAKSGPPPPSPAPSLSTPSVVPTLGSAASGFSAQSYGDMMITVGRYSQGRLVESRQVPLSSMSPNETINLSLNPQIPNPTHATSVYVRDARRFIQQGSYLGLQDQYKDWRVANLDPLTSQVHELEQRKAYIVAYPGDNAKNAIAAIDSALALLNAQIAPLQAQAAAAFSAAKTSILGG